VEPAELTAYALEVLGEPYRPADHGWRTRAACRGHDVNGFIVKAGAPTRPARRICMACPVREPCLRFALLHEETVGVWGGTTEGDRRAMRRASA
jgi:WhiB family redox-sensing transcriptional regulator